MKISNNKDELLINLSLIITVLLFVFFGLTHLSKFITADEHYWVYDRIPQYWNAIGDFDLKKTFINDKPGVSIALFSFPGLLYEKNPNKLIREVDSDLSSYDVESITKTLFAFRLPLILLCSLFLFYLFWIISKVTDRWVALWTIILTGLSPVIIGVSQIINPDALLWIFSTSAIFSYLAFLKHKTKSYLILTTIFTGFALLSKYTANILFPLYMFFMVFGFFFENDTFSTMNGYFKRNVKAFFMILVGSFAVFAFFMPAIIIRPAYFYRATLGINGTLPLWTIVGTSVLFLYLDSFFWKNYCLKKLHKLFLQVRSSTKLLPVAILLIIATLIIGRLLENNWQLFEKIPFDLKDLDSAADKAIYFPNIFEKVLLEFNPLIFSLTPITLLLASIYWFKNIFIKETKKSFIAFSLTFFIFAYFLSFLVTNVLATVRYSIIIYPLIAFIAALGAQSIAEKLKWKIVPISLTFVLIIFSVSSLFLIKPFYFNYINFLLPKNQTITDAWGFGGYEATQFLNNLPNAKNINVWSDYYGVCEFLEGNCITDNLFDQKKYPIDYYVLTRRGRIKYTPAFNSRLGKKPNFSQAFRYYDRTDPVWQLSIGDRDKNYIKIFKTDELRAAIITDIDHCPSRAPASIDHLDNFLKFSKEKKADFIISLGDNASHRLRNCSATADMDARFIADYLRTSTLPAHFVLGDHDIGSNIKSYQNWLETIQRKEAFHSLDAKDVHIIILDTILGGEPMSPSCKEDAYCASVENRLSELNKIPFKTYIQKYTDAKKSFKEEGQALDLILQKMYNSQKITRSWSVRDRGQISEKELAWLAADINATKHSRVLIFSDHPLFKFASPKKVYDVTNGDKAREILEKSGKEIVAISGEAHLWHEEKQGRIQYFIVDEFRKSNGSWAYFTWDKTGFHLEKETH